MLFRNRELRRALAAALATTAALALVAASLVTRLAPAEGPVAAGVAAGALVAATGLALAAGFGALTAWRYRRLAELAARIDEALHADRVVRLADMEEGELAVLASETDKALSRLRRANEALDAERSSLADSLADISHQLRTPLTSLGLTLELLRKDDAVRADGSLAGRVRMATGLVEQVQWLVEALLKLARLDAGVISLHPTDTPARDLVEAAAAPLEVAYELAGVRLERRVQPDAHLSCDAGWTREALENVLKNCLEHTPAGGTVTVEAAEDALACRIRVRDTGPGIAPEDLPHVFERFYRGSGAPADGASRALPAGAGIGLALAQGLVSAQGGRITAANRTGPDGGVAGATFELAFFKAVV